MTKREFTRLARRYLEPLLPGFEIEDGFLYLPPATYLLRSVFHGSSAYTRESFYVFYSVAPLYTPGSLWALGIGERTAWEWPRGDEAGEARVMSEIAEMLERDARPLFDRIDSPASVARYLEERARWQADAPYPEWRAHWRMNPRDHEVLAYSLILGREYVAALASLEDLIPLTDRLAHTRPDAHGNLVPREPDPDDWAVRARERAENLHRVLAASPEQAVQLLEGWAAAQREEAGLG